MQHPPTIEPSTAAPPTPEPDPPTPDEPQRAEQKVRTILIVDEHPIFRAGIRAVLAEDHSLSIIAEADTEHDALAHAQRHDPDIIIIDLLLTDGSGFELAKRLHATRPQARLLILSSLDERVFAERALRAGANGYLHKSEPPERLLHAIHTILQGDTALSLEMTNRLINQAVRAHADEPTGVAALTDRELEVFQMIGHAQTTRAIAERLSISIKTVETHRENIKRKLGIDNAPELARYAVAWAQNPF